MSLLNYGLLACSCVSSVALLAMLFYLGGRTIDVDSPERIEPEGDAMRPFLLWHSFYVNPHDPRGTVPKISGVGWTVNFRTRRNVTIFAVLILISLVSAIGLVVSLTVCG